MFNFFYLIIGTIFTIVLCISYIKICQKCRIFLISDDYKRKNIVNSAGLILLFYLLVVFLFFFYNENFSSKIFYNIPRPYIFFFSILSLGILSLYDDIKPINFRIRLLFQFSIIFFSVSLIEVNFLPEIPLKIKQYFIIIFWVYLLNIQNFLDGLDGFLLLNFLNALLIVLIKFLFDGAIYVSTLISYYMLPVIIAMLMFNFPKAKFFLGDVGSILLGFILGFIFFDLIKNGNFFVAFIIIAYGLFDTTITLMLKIINGKKPWDRLFDYFFLRPVILERKSHLFSTIPLIIYLIATNINLFFSLRFNINSIYSVSTQILFLICLLFFYSRFRSAK